MDYTMKQFAEMFQTTEHTLRYYTDIGLLPCKRDSGNRRVFDDASANWMQGITYLKKCGASLQDIKEYCRLCRLEESEENLRARYQIIKKQQEQAHRRAAEAKAAADYIDYKVQHYEDILAGLAPDDMNPGSWGQGKQGE
jgi:DNA-binding transcriptional MerR regulator